MLELSARQCIPCGLIQAYASISCCRLNAHLSMMLSRSLRFQPGRYHVPWPRGCVWSYNIFSGCVRDSYISLRGDISNWLVRTGFW